MTDMKAEGPCLAMTLCRWRGVEPQLWDLRRVETPDVDAGDDTTSPGGHDLLDPDSTPNPALHRFLDAATRRAVDEFAPLLPADADPLTQQLLGPPLPALPPAVAEALSALPTVFPLKTTVWLAVGWRGCVH